MISSPDAIVVSGDIVQGCRLGATGFRSVLKAQYAEALELLKKLSDTFLGGDRSRVILVPGNHDVDWNTARAAMRTAVMKGQNIPGLLSIPNSPYRWSWKTRRLYKITDFAKYEKRFDGYKSLIKEFYDGVSLTFPLDPNRYWNLYQLDDGRILVCAFNSCNGNDCYNLSGDIPYDAIANSHISITSLKSANLNIAVWHHNTSGPPSRSDYMDDNRLPLFIDKGFRLGLHGHHHKSEVTAHNFFTSDMESMALVSAGSLCAGSIELPTGFRREYNIIEIADDYKEAKVHVREMRGMGVFVPGRLISSGKSSNITVKWTEVKATVMVNTGRAGAETIQMVEGIERLISNGKYESALLLIQDNDAVLGSYGRQLKAKALFGNEDWEQIILDLSEPENIFEVALFTRAAIQLRNWNLAESNIQKAYLSEQYENGTLKELENEIKIAKLVSL